MGDLEESNKCDIELGFVFVFAYVRHSNNPWTILRNNKGIIIKHLSKDTESNMTLVFNIPYHK